MEIISEYSSSTGCGMKEVVGMLRGSSRVDSCGRWHASIWICLLVIGGNKRGVVRAFQKEPTVFLCVSLSLSSFICPS